MQRDIWLQALGDQEQRTKDRFLGRDWGRGGGQTFQGPKELPSYPLSTRPSVPSVTLWPVDATPLDERRVNFPRLSRARAYYKINIKLTRVKEKYVLARLTCDVARPRSPVQSPKRKPDRLPEGD